MMHNDQCITNLQFIDGNTSGATTMCARVLERYFVCGLCMQINHIGIRYLGTYGW